jgi:hypothetical protein
MMAEEGWQIMDRKIIFLGGERAIFWRGGVWDLFGVFRGDIWALTEQGPPKVACGSTFVLQGAAVMP